MIPVLPLDEARKLAQQANINERMSELNAFRTLLQSPKAAGAVANLLSTLMYRNTLDARLRELIILRTGWRTGSEYEFCQHWGVARQLKMTDEEILGVRDPANCPVYDELDRAVIRAADELLDNAEVSRETWSTLERSLSPAAMVELLLCAGFWRAMAGYLKSARVALDPIDPTITGWPEGRAPK
ncbi:MAG: carboxymuconolactone decarboxylase family protein [Candidatus Binataceae bacterium]